MWSSIEKRRAFFEKYALNNNFDPLLPKNWYTVTRASILNFRVTFLEFFLPYWKLNINIQGARRVLSYHKDKLSRALLDLFPNIGLEKSKFRSFRMKLFLHLWTATNSLLRLQICWQKKIFFWKICRSESIWCFNSISMVFTTNLTYIVLQGIINAHFFFC